MRASGLRQQRRARAPFAEVGDEERAATRLQQRRRGEFEPEPIGVRP